MQNIDLTQSKTIPISFLNEEDAKKQSSYQKGWSFSYVYHFSELKDIYLVLRNTELKRPIDILNYHLELGLKYEKTPWEERRILEQINALKNFGLVSGDNEVVKQVFDESTIGSPLTKEDLVVFKDIYFSYFRFIEMHSWFLDPESDSRIEAMGKVTEEELANKSKVLFPFILNSRFTNAFILNLANSTKIYSIGKGNEDLMRFWDVYVKWGQSLGLLEKFSLKELDVQFSSNVKSLSCIYFMRDEIANFNLYDFIKREYKAKYIQVPKLIFKIAKRHRFSLEGIKDLIITQSLNNSEQISLQRTSEIFIRGKGKILFPKYRGSYISHLTLL